MSDGSGGESASREDDLAPVIPLFGNAASAHGPVSERGASTARSDIAPFRRYADDATPIDRRTPSGVRFVPDDTESAPIDIGQRGDAAVVEAAYDVAERALLRKLRTRSLSVSEARSTMSGLAASSEEIEQLVEDFLRRGYLDDAALAEQLVHSSVTRKRQGRRAIGMELSRRGIPRAIADAALAALPDDDDDRALDFARSKARGFRGVDRDAALRRLVGQLSRRGFPSGVAMTAARTALDEIG